MKKITILLALILCLGMVSTVSAKKGGDSRTLSNGFSVNLVTGIPSASFGAPEDVSSDEKYGAMFGLQLGNRWYFAPKENYGFGLMVNWIDFAYAGKSVSSEGLDIARATMDITALSFGPVATYALSDEMALDIFYNLRPTLLISANVMTATSITGAAADQTYAYAGAGISHKIGAAFRYKVFNAGVEYVMGGISSKGTYTGAMNDVTLGDETLKTNSLRIVLGFKF